MELIVKILKKLHLLDFALKVKKNRIRRKRLTKKVRFENRSKDKEKLLIVLAGYKPFLYEIVFKRIKKFVDNDIEICIVSSGKYDEKLSEIAEKNDWSYLSVKRNNVALAQNVAINSFPNAKLIYKLDEDIFVTKNYFKNLLKTMNDCEKNGEYKPGFIAPMIPINGFSNMLVLERFNKKKEYEKRFEKPLYKAGRERMIESNPDVAKAFWGENDFLPQLDEMNKIVNKDKMDYVSCPIRFSIGAILFERKLWEDMGMFEVKSGPGMGLDEEQICSYCMISSNAIIVSKNTIVGHLSFGTQNESMKKYFEEHKDVFNIQ